jgi:hypothetical protein
MMGRLILNIFAEIDNPVTMAWLVMRAYGLSVNQDCAIDKSSQKFVMHP